jgi:predicted  nucleic acid-binding Zn-ribbon protein
MEDRPKFSSADDELQFWKTKAKTLEQQAKDAREELEEFQESSKELEQELEAQLEQAEKSSKEFKSLANRLQLENDSLKDKLEQCHKEYHYQVPEDSFLKEG